MTQQPQPKALRHGEIFLLPIEKFPRRGKTQKHTNYVVGHSESGNNHVLESKAKFDVKVNKDDLYLRLFEPGKLVHHKTTDRHKDLTLNPGVYKVISKQEYSPWEGAMQRVLD